VDRNLAPIPFSDRLIAWHEIHGRHDLPWQNTSDPYRVWVSEIMLQQTQVATVIPYYRRFVARFPDIATLATVDEEEVLRLWSGLGYYSRGRNLHRAARLIMAEHDGRFPRDPTAIAALPGIGRSTAAAIAAFCYGAREAILDGNVKRVLARRFGIEGWPGERVVENRLWALAESLLPETDVETYAQALMDLGAGLCLRRNPACDACPVETDCIAHRTGRQHVLPAPRPRKPLPQKRTVMLILRHGPDILLEKRPPTGIWAGMWSLPEIAPEEDPVLASRRYGLAARPLTAMPTVRHSFTHFRLQITPLPMQVSDVEGRAEEDGRMWTTPEEAAEAAIPTPVRKLLLKLEHL
jgi:A/G-specific adenine glycosylase